LLGKEALSLCCVISGCTTQTMYSGDIEPVADALRRLFREQ
jgi:hypothetical protein